jgi:flagellar protein FlbD
VIHVSRIGGSAFMVNATMIELIESTPDTVITLVSGHKYVVRESAEEVADHILSYYRSIGVVGTHAARGRSNQEDGEF